MKTEILTNELLKLINPSKDGVLYKGQNIKIDFKQLKKYVDEPKKNKVFQITGEFEADLHKNLALYIINSNEASLISMDLNSPNIFAENRGLFEYIKNVYNKEEKSFINIGENGDNLLLIQSKKLKPLSEEFSIQDAEDMHYATAASTFSSNPDLYKKTKGQVTWEQLNSDMYSDLNYVMGKVREVFAMGSNSRYDEETSYKKLFKNLSEKINPNLLHSDEFKFAILDMNSSDAHEFFLDRFLNNKNNEYFIDFAHPTFQNKMLSNIKNNNLHLLESAFNFYLSYVSSYDQEDAKMAKKLDGIFNFKNLLNQPETIAYLLKQDFSRKSSISDADDSFSIVSAYPLLSEENRTDKYIGEKYSQLICTKSMDGGYYANESLVYKLEPSVFNEKIVLTQLVKVLDFEKTRQFLKKSGTEPTLLSDKEFVVSMANGLPTWRLNSWISSFFDKSTVDEEFITSLVKKQPSFYEQLSGRKIKFLSQFEKNADILLTAVDSGLPLKEIPEKIMISFLVENHDEKFEIIKVKYLIEHRAIDNPSYELELKGETLTKVKEKYQKPEYLFYRADDWSINASVKGKSLAHLKTLEEALEILDKIKKQDFEYTFLSSLFYESLPKPLKKNAEVANRILELGPIKYSSLNDTLAYNSEIAFKCVQLNPENIKDVPQELFTNAKFALQVTQLMDKGVFRKTPVPSFVTKFFENQGVTRDFEKHLKEHLFFTDMQADLDKPISPSTTPRKNKI